MTDDASRIRELRVARGVAKRQLTFLERFITTISPATNIFVIEARFETMNGIRNDFDVAQKELERLDPNETAEPADGQLTEREDFENRFIQVKASFQQIIRDNPDSSFNPSHNSTVVDITSDLPRFDIPDFHGGYDEYTTFMDIFDTLVHRSTSRSVTNVRKLGYLKGACKGRAYDVIKHLPLTNDNYEVARAMLRDRFSNPRLSFQECIDKIWNAPKASSASSLRAVSDLINSQLRALERLGTREQISNGILIHLAVSKFDSTTKSKWEEHLASSTEIPSWENLTQFLNKRCTVWEAIEVTKVPTRSVPAPTQPRLSDPPRKNYTATSTPVQCLMCNGPCASLLECKKYNELSPKRRSNLAREWKLCYNCLQPQHENPCTSPNCVHCGRNHHTILHYGKVPTNVEVPPGTTITQPTLTCKNLISAAYNNNRETVNNENISVLNQRAWTNFDNNYCFLATAVVLVKNSFGEYVPMRVLLDGAAQSSFITAKAATLLGLDEIETRIELAGVHGNTKTLKKAVKIEMKSSVNEACGEFFAVINPYYRDSHPSKCLDVSDWEIPSNIPLADPHFNVPREVDILINAHLTYEWQYMGQIRLGDDKPILQKTMLGWVIVGNCNTLSTRTPPYTINLVSTGQIQQTMERFWSVEEVQPDEKSMTREESECERHFLAHVARSPDGRFIVKLPFKMDPCKLGSSYVNALRRFKQIRQKFLKDDQLDDSYCKFMQEYHELGHMKLAAVTDQAYYIPHFSVLNPGSTTTGFRVVFDASAPTESGLSLNDALMVGPNIQRDLFTHLLTFRCKPIAITGDISKMYRQIQVAEEHQKWQTILWGDKQPFDEYQLTTVTYGTASASFLATRVLKYLADDEKDLLVGASAIRDHMYVDDLIAAADTIQEALQIVNEVSAILKKGQLPIRKFCSNSPEVLAGITSDLHGLRLKVGDKDLLKALGMLWDPTTDNFLYYHEDSARPITKKGILSEISSLFDPLGLVAPVTVMGKMFMQELWATKLAWDESLPQSLATTWEKIRTQLPNVNKITVPRLVITNPHKVVMHGFADASKKAYACVLYVSSMDIDGTVTTRLLASKTKVAPLKTLTLPRLELLGALLLTRLYRKVRPMLPFECQKIYLWVDASIALTWIRASPHKWTDFVGARVTEIQNSTRDCEWRHVPTDQNPADIASRGMLPVQLSESALWFNGPAFLKQNATEWPSRFQEINEVPETAAPKRILTVAHIEPDLVRQSKYHSWLSLQKVFGYVARFIASIRKKQERPALWKPGSPLPHALSALERDSK